MAWATDYATKNSKLTLKFGDNIEGGQVANGQFTPYSTDPATLLSQVSIWAGASRFRAVDWSTYVLGRQSWPRYRNASSYQPGPYTGVNSKMFSLNPNVQKTESVNGSADSFYPNYTGDYYPQPDQYVPNVDASDPNSFAKRLSWDAASHTMTIDLGDQPTGSMIVFGVSGQSTSGNSGATNQTFGLEANFDADYAQTDKTNTVCYPATLSWNNTDAQSGKLLPGATFELTPTDATGKLAEKIVVPDAVGTTGTDTNPAGGQYTISNESTGGKFLPGTWSAQQITPPDGYTVNPNAQPVIFDFEHQTINAENILNKVNTAPSVSVSDVSVAQGDSG